MDLSCWLRRAPCRVAHGFAWACGLLIRGPASFQDCVSRACPRKAVDMAAVPRPESSKGVLSMPRGNAMSWQSSGPTSQPSRGTPTRPSKTQGVAPHGTRRHGTRRWGHGTRRAAPPGIRHRAGTTTSAAMPAWKRPSAFRTWTLTAKTWCRRSSRLCTLRGVNSATLAICTMRPLNGAWESVSV
jgi:hypothetical protein